MTEVVFDSSFLMAVVQRPTTWFEDIVLALGRFDPIMLDCVSAELRNLESGAGKRSRTARVALGLAENFKMRKCEGGSADSEIILAALSSGAAVATTDKELTRALAKLHVKVLGLRSGRVAVV